MPSKPSLPPTDRQRPFSIIEFGNLVSAALAVDNENASRFSESFLQLDPDLSLTQCPEQRISGKHDPRSCRSYGNNGDNGPVISFPTSPFSPPLLPRPIDDLSLHSQNMKFTLNHSARTRRLLKKIRHILRPTSPIPSSPDQKGVLYRPQLDSGGLELTPNQPECSGPAPTPIPSVDLPSVFYNERCESIADDEQFTPFLPLAFHQERDHGWAISKRTRPRSSSLPDGISIFSRTPSQITRPSRGYSRPATAHSGYGTPAASTSPPATHGHTDDYLHSRDELAGNHRPWSAQTSHYAPSIPSCYSTMENFGSPRMRHPPAMASSSRVHPSGCGGSEEMDASTYASGSEDTHRGPMDSQSDRSFPSLSYPLSPAIRNQRDWTLSLPLGTRLALSTPLEINAAFESSSDVDKHRSDGSSTSDACTFTSSSLSQMSSLQQLSSYPGRTTTTLLTASTSPTTLSFFSPSFVDKPLPPLPRSPIDPPSSVSDGKGKQKETAYSGIVGEERAEDLGAISDTLLLAGIGADPSGQGSESSSSTETTPEIPRPDTPNWVVLKSTSVKPVMICQPSKSTESDRGSTMGTVYSGNPPDDEQS